MIFSRKYLVLANATKDCAQTKKEMAKRAFGDPYHSDG